MIRRIGLAAVILVVGVFTVTQTVIADFTQEIQRCENARTQPDIRIVACTRNIQSGRFTGKNLAIAYSNRAQAYRRKMQWDEAIADFDEAIRLNPGFVFAFNNRGNVYYFKGQFDRAIEDYDMAIHRNPDDARIFADRGLAYEMKGQLTQALRDFNKAYALGFRHSLLLQKLRDLGEMI